MSSYWLLYNIFVQKVDYPLELDIYDLCSDDLKKSLEVPRQVFVNSFAYEAEGHVNNSKLWF